MPHWLWFILIGVIAGWLAGVITRGYGFGLVGDLIVGAIGAVIGGWLFEMAGLTAYSTLAALAMAVIGAVALLAVIRVIKRA